jgi:hypothetical protein
VAEAVEADLDAVGVEADGGVELEAGGDGRAWAGDGAGREGDDAGRRIAGEVVPAVWATPSTATRIDPPTGFLISRRQGAKLAP